MAAKIALTLGISTAPHSRALFEGAVRPEGIELTCISAYGERNASARIMEGTLEGGEFSLSSLMQAKARGIHLCALPIFLGRGFVHRGLWRRAGSGIESPTDYVGKRVAMHRYNNSAGMWARALLSQEYGVALDSIRWYAAVREPPGESLPPHRDVTYIDGPREQLAEMLDRGEIDGALERFLYKSGPAVERVFEDYHAAEADHFHRTRIFPMFHALVLRPEVIDGRDWILDSLLEGFRESRKRASEFMEDWERREADWLLSVLDDDPYAYRLGESERRSFRYLNQLLIREGVLETTFDPDQFFAITG